LLSKLTNNSIKLGGERLIYQYDEYEEFSQALAKQTKTRLVSSEKLAIAWFETRIMLEEEAYFDQSGVNYLDGRQTQFHLIKSVQ
jgi:hypothetical protein